MENLLQKYTQQIGKYIMLTNFGQKKEKEYCYINKDKLRSSILTGSNKNEIMGVNEKII